VAVEAAMVLPLMVFLTLGIIQLTMVQHARLMTEYAAYQAARAGIVWNGNNERMHDAAILALTPTLGRTDSLPRLGKVWAFAQVYDKALSLLQWRHVKAWNGSNIAGMVRVDTINPSYFSAIDTIWKLREANWQELDFDGPDSYPDVPDPEKRIARFLNLEVQDDKETVFRRATVLSIRVRYWYNMRVPFANYILFMAWYASNAGMSLHGAIDRATTERGANMMNRRGDVTALAARGRGIQHQKGLDTVHPLEMPVLWLLATQGLPRVGVPDGPSVGGRLYFLPLSATYSMRMQSNFHRKWLMHVKPEWGL
jgi:hypothetical protein